MNFDKTYKQFLVENTDSPKPMWCRNERLWRVKNKNKVEYFKDRDCKILHNDLPAVEYDNGYKAWYKNGMRHRLTGPAIIRNGRKTEEYWINGKLLTLDDFNRLSKFKDEDLNTGSDLLNI